MIECLPTSPTAGSYATVAGDERVLVVRFRSPHVAQTVFHARQHRTAAHLQMNAGLITETCRIGWWKGYVKGRFVAVLESEARQPVLVAESPSGRWRGSAPPDPTDEARHALDALTDELVAAGWTLDESPPEVWYERVLTRPATALAAVARQAGRGARPSRRPCRGATRVAGRATAPLGARAGPRRGRAPAAAEERSRRARASRRDATARVAAPAAPPRSRERRALWIVLELASVAAAAAIFLLVLDSAYAAVVAGLTTGAVVLALDSLFAVRSRGDAVATPPP